MGGRGRAPKGKRRFRTAGVACAECGCGYLSDLRVPETAPALAQTVKRIPHGIWSGEAWREVARYITGESDIIPEEDVARAALSRWLQKR